MIGRSGWTLNHLVVLLLMGAFALLLIEVRSLHHAVLREHAIAWAPIAYSGLMLVAIAIAVPLWDRGGRRALFWAFAPALVIGPVGCWFHNDGRPLHGLGRELAAWARPIGPPAGEESQESGAQPAHEDAPEDEGGPPALAPLAIAGLGLLGMLACARRFQPPEPVGGQKPGRR